MKDGQERMVGAAVAEGVLDRAPHAALFYDLDRVARRIEELRAAFPSGTLHALAVKACPIAELLRRTTAMGCGAEVASLAELRHALRVGIPPGRIVFDSPAKTEDELRFALEQSVHVNADSLQEIDRIGGILRVRGDAPVSIGVRVNPEVRAGSIESSSTGMAGSKFGVSLHDDEAGLLERFETFPWLRGLHVHVGSQGCSLDLLVDGVGRVLELADRIERLCGAGRLRTFDLGGGLSAAYQPGEVAPGFDDYANLLHDRAPRLFAEDWQLITEFGRAVWASSAIALTRVEYTKTSHGRQIAIGHLGADMFPRTAYLPDVWPHEVRVFGRDGRPKGGQTVEQDIAGPLCFSGDLVARGRPLPLIEPGDIVLVADVGAYTLSMWSRYNSRVSPPVYGSTHDSPDLIPLRRGEDVDRVLDFWE
ncbi:MAG: diaminopimelate decarboxylase [Candidatus Eisenbacteria bacterium]